MDTLSRGALRSSRLLACLITGCLLVVAGPGAGGARAAGAGPVSWASPKLVDTQVPLSAPNALSGVSCPTSTQCLAIGENGTIVTYGTPAGSRSGPIDTVVNGVDRGASLSWISCPSASLCVITEPQALLVSTDPLAAKPTWTHEVVKLGDDEYDGVTCASARLCLTWEDSGIVRVSTDPAGGASTWKATSLPKFGNDFVYGASCVPATAECTISIGDADRGPAGFETSANAAGGASAWTLTTSPTLDTMNQLSCVSATLCVGVSDGSVWTSTNPAGGASTWTGSQLVDGQTRDLQGVACAPSSGTCVIPISDGSVAVSTAAQNGGASYTISGVLDPAKYGTANVNALACMTASTCLIPDATPGLAVVSVRPPVTNTVLTGFGGTTAFTGLDCLSATLCLGVDDGGGILRTTSPGGAASSWHRTVQPAAATPPSGQSTIGLDAIDCVSMRFCIATGANDVIETTTHPASATAWTPTTLKYQIVAGSGTYVDDLDAVSCPSTKLCMIGNGEYGIIATTNPTGGRSAYHLDPVGAFDADTWNAVSCPSTKLCVAGDDSFGQIAVTTKPAAKQPDWKIMKIAAGTGSLAPGFDAISCPSAKLCVAGATSGAVYWSTDPAGGKQTWHRTVLAKHSIRGLSCSSTKLCTLSDGHQTVYSTADPTGPKSAWHAKVLATGTFPIASAATENLTTVACAPTKLCLAGSGAGLIFRGQVSAGPGH